MHVSDLYKWEGIQLSLFHLCTLIGFLEWVRIRWNYSKFARNYILPWERGTHEHSQSCVHSGKFLRATAESCYAGLFLLNLLYILNSLLLFKVLFLVFCFEALFGSSEAVWWPSVKRSLVSSMLKQKRTEHIHLSTITPSLCFGSIHFFSWSCQFLPFL